MARTRLAAFTIALLAIVGCGSRNPVAGTWESSHRDGIVFADNGTVSIGSANGPAVSATYVVKDATTIVVTGALGMQDVMHLQGDVLTSTLSRGLTYRRVAKLDFPLPTP